MKSEPRHANIGNPSGEYRRDKSPLPMGLLCFCATLAIGSATAADQR
jgi:hypothetical protein